MPPLPDHRPAAPTAPLPTQPTWKRIVKWAHSTLFIAAWLEGMAFFYVYGTRIRAGSLTPTATYTVPINDHGTNVYLSSQDAALVNLLELIMLIAIPTSILSGLFLQSVLGIRVFDNRGKSPKRARESR